MTPSDPVRWGEPPAAFQARSKIAPLTRALHAVRGGLPPVSASIGVWLVTLSKNWPPPLVPRRPGDGNLWRFTAQLATPSSTDRDWKLLASMVAYLGAPEEPLVPYEQTLPDGVHRWEWLALCKSTASARACREAGLCSQHCGRRAAPGRSMCEPCRSRHNEGARRRYRSSGDKHHCSRCGLVGHNKRRCPEVTA